MTNKDLALYLRVCADLARGTEDLMAWIRPDIARLAAERLEACPEPRR